MLLQLNATCAFCLAINVTVLIDRNLLPLFPQPWSFNIRSLHMKTELQTTGMLKIFYWSNCLSNVFVISSDHPSCSGEGALLYRNPEGYRDYFHLQPKLLSLLALWEKLMSYKYQSAWALLLIYEVRLLCSPCGFWSLPSPALTWNLLSVPQACFTRSHMTPQIATGFS